MNKINALINKIKLKKTDHFLSSPGYTFFSMSLTFLAAGILITPVFSETSLERLIFLSAMDRWILGYISLEMTLRLVSRKKKYLQDLFFLDLITVFPLFLELIFFIFSIAPGEEMEFPGLLLLRGMRVIRLVYFFQYFYLRKQLGMVTNAISSVIKARFFLGISTFVFLLIVLVGMAISYMHNRLTESQRAIRVERIKGHARVYGIANTQQIYEESILMIRQTGPGKNFDIILKQPDYIKKYYRYNRDFIQIDGIIPGSSIQISFKDLNQRQLHLEFALLISGMVVIASILFSLNRYLDILVLNPIDRAIRVMDLRAKGEEIEDSDIPQEPFTEITILINKGDILYKKMRAPRNPVPKLPEFKIRSAKKLSFNLQSL